MSELYKLPAGWEWKKLGDLFKITSSKRVHKKDWLDKGIPFYRAREIVKLAQNGYVDNELFISEDMYNSFASKYGLPKENDILVTGVGTLGIPFVVKKNDKFYFKDGNIIWLKNENGTNPKYIEYCFSSQDVRNQINSNNGSTVATYTITNANNTIIPLPPLAEQKRIVAKLDSLFEKIDKAIELHQQNITNANTLMASTLDKTFKKLEGEYGMNDILDGIYIGCRKGYKPEIIDGKVPFIGMQDIDQYNGINTNYVLEDYEKVSKGKTKFEKNAVLVGKITPCTQNNKTSIVPSNINGGFATTEVYALHSKNNMNPFYLNYFVRSKDINDYLVSTMIGATGRQRVPSDAITSLKIPLPPLPIQQQTVEYLDSIATKVDKIKQLNEQKLENLKALKASILDKAFRGEL
ncbi:restriction endonuclease subunit S [Francisella tularensis subsp. novicida]|uniref:Type I restriction endonuclease subunit S n=2 Tax=Francisella tularensis TaxID=263 RepID=A0A6I4RTV9_FRATU|nr:restriction endonuclease subunit S [Francisella tularensis]ABK90040.1 type I restriction-modification system, subunit S [Francisella tularensis subsp. novicida U112]AJI60875.1 type I restriction modification DNA specificity domain protein [Francisella tularensis subsp. novicida U112]EDX19562.1 type I restriction modification DNA specificity domain protein [Francisella tularensis subsp. novicida FTE]MBK2036506.1 restriction endonuclease subunit S [Francisella tularensis subsp. novicida]MBK21